MSLKQRGIRAEYLGSTQTDKSVHAEAESGNFDLLYMTPEKACSLPPRWEVLSTISFEKPAYYLSLHYKF